MPLPTWCDYITYPRFITLLCDDDVDEVCVCVLFFQKEYGSVIEKAISTMVTVPNEKLTYEYMEAIITEVVQHFPDIPQRVGLE